MTKRTKPPRRTQSQQQSRWIMGGAVMLVVAAALFLILSNSGEAAPEVVDERLTLDPVLGNTDAPVTPEHLRSDNGPEFIAHAVQLWLRDQGCATVLPQAAPGRTRSSRASTASCAPSV